MIGAPDETAGAGPARVVAERDAIARSDVGDTVADGGHHAGALVAEHDREGRRERSAVDGDIRMAEPSRRDVHKHLARFVVDIVAQLDLKPLYARYGNRGGAPYAPEILLGLLVYAYANGVFSSRKIEQATKDTAPFRYLAGNYSPDHDTLAAFRKQFE